MLLWSQMVNSWDSSSISLIIELTVLTFRLYLFFVSSICGQWNKNFGWWFKFFVSSTRHFSFEAQSDDDDCLISFPKTWNVITSGSWSCSLRALSASDMVYAVSIVISNLDLMCLYYMYLYLMYLQSTLGGLGFKCFVGSTFDLWPFSWDKISRCAFRAYNSFFVFVISLWTVSYWVLKSSDSCIVVSWIIIPFFSNSSVISLICFSLCSLIKF